MQAMNKIVQCAVLVLAGGTLAPAQAPDRSSAKRLVLVELFTSQGCDMCPEAERLLGTLAAHNNQIVPVAFHVDYFNDPWHDPFSDALYSQRQMTYDQVYTKAKDPNLGLYYTPMLMIDGAESVNGRNAAGAQAAVRDALGRKPLVDVVPKLELADDRRSGKLQVSLSALSTRVRDRELLVCAVLRDDSVVTRVRSGENANKTLTNRFPARETKYEDIRLGNQPATLSFPFALDPAWKIDRLAVVVFAQDKRSGVVYQTVLVPWMKK
jgi:hypothetical protein